MAASNRTSQLVSGDRPQPPENEASWMMFWRFLGQKKWVFWRCWETVGKKVIGIFFCLGGRTTRCREVGVWENKVLGRKVLWEQVLGEVLLVAR